MTSLGAWADLTAWKALHQGRHCTQNGNCHDFRCMSWRSELKSACSAQLHNVMSRAGIEWEEATLRGKAMSLLMDWDASRPHTGVRPSCQSL